MTNKSCEHDGNPIKWIKGDRFAGKFAFPTCPFCPKAEHEEKPTTDDNADWFIKYYKIDKTHGEHDEMKWTLRKIIAGERMEERLASEKRESAIETQSEHYRHEAETRAKTEDAQRLTINRQKQQISALEKKVAELEAKIKEYERPLIDEDSALVTLNLNYYESLKSKLDEAVKALVEIQKVLQTVFEEIETQKFGEIKICDRTAFSISRAWAVCNESVEALRKIKEGK